MIIISDDFLARWQPWFLLFIHFYFLKAIFVGSSFNFYLWARYGRKYTRWYFDEKRTTFPKES